MVKLPGLLLAAGLVCAQSPDTAPENDKHIFGVVPSYNPVNMTPGGFEPLTRKEKFKLATLDSFDPFPWVTSAMYAGIGQLNNSHREFGQGAAGFGKRYGGAFADQVISNYMSEAILPSLTHQDPRLFRMGQGRPLKRVAYAMSRVLISRSDEGARRFNFSEIGGNLIAAAISNAYYPASDRTVGDTLEKAGVAVGADAAFNVLKEFWPDIRRKFLKR